MQHDLDLPPPLLEVMNYAIEQPYHFPPSLIYNEGWLLRTLLTWAATNRDRAPAPLRFAPGATWFSEAALRPPFHKQEGESKADGVIGHFHPRPVFNKAWGKRTTISGIVIAPTATQFVVIEAKLGAPFSRGIKHYRRYSQVTRTVGCIAEELAFASRETGQLIEPAQFTDGFAFYVLAPDGQRAELEPFLAIEQIVDEMKQRSTKYSRYKQPDAWRERWFRLVLDRLAPSLTSIVPWHTLIAEVVAVEPSLERPLWTLYNRCCLARRVTDPHIPRDIVDPATR